MPGDSAPMVGDPRRYSVCIPLLIR